MIKILLFLASLVVSLFLVLYSELTWQLIIVYGSKKLVLNFWFAILVVLLVYLSIHWVLNKIGFIFRLPDIWRQYQWTRKLKEREYAQGQAIIYALSGNYKAALGHISSEKDQNLSDMILRAIWLNQLKDVQALDEVLGKLVSLNKIPDGWMIWFRAYLLYERGKQHLATDLLLDAIESGLYTQQIVKTFVDYADPEIHFNAMLSHYHLLLRYAGEKKVLPKILKGAKVHMNQLIVQKKWDDLSQALQNLPKSIRQDKEIHYYLAQKLLAEGYKDKLLNFLMTTSFLDDRLIPLLANMDLPITKKIEVVSQGLIREPNNKNLLYLLSYLHAQSGSVDDTVKMLENAMFKDS